MLIISINDYAVLGYMEHMMWWWKDNDCYKYVEHNIEQSPCFTIGVADSFQEAKEILYKQLANGWVVYNCSGEFASLNNMGELVL